ncbi:MAG TPA: NADH-quinone oxidoreductase subunit C [Gaiellaceae bacterium]|nr:NADH-quinone oxidoreductase subunit C [Gaiellaceae bacterium]
MSGYRDAVGQALAEGCRLGALYASGEVVRTVLVSTAGETRLAETPVVDGRVPSIVDLAPAAAWDEREAADLYDLDFDGHEPLRPLVDHDVDLESWTARVRGDDVHQVAVGPIHAGVIESGHFRLHVVGERVVHLDIRLFHKHRGLERAAEGSDAAGGIAFARRACAACAVSNSVAYAQAWEEALGLVSTPELARTRTILLELERLWSHLNDIGAICAGVGFAAGTASFSALTERARRLNAALTGHRFLFDTVSVGGSSVSLSVEDLAHARRELDALREDSRRAWRELLFNASFQDRLPDIGVVGAEDARALGAVGPAARASGLPDDARATSHRLAYDGFRSAAPRRTGGDVQARLEQRAVEVQQTFDLLEPLLADPVGPSATVRGAPEAGIGVGRVESPRGATVCVVERDHERIGRLHLRTGSYANWAVVAHSATGNLLPDFPLINKSFELCYACADR